jgi:hypothetical protein
VILLPVEGRFPGDGSDLFFLSEIVSAMPDRSMFMVRNPNGMWWIFSKKSQYETFSLLIRYELILKENG